eukprot:TRINITY_DN33036_c0_g1_i1.p2 TRINITY_DN33036_c0_g1~~TRINITY_DN33036_c0_g1_i1.p2  ORF type:complete len:308 (-),score=43.14 TRINITY_DN33036_c0_g1_i1:56-979(-)
MVRGNATSTKGHPIPPAPSRLWTALRLLPLAVWLIFYKASQSVPDHVRSSIDVATLPWVEYTLFGWLFGGYPHQVFDGHHSTLADVLAAMVYTVHFVAPLLFVVWLYRRHSCAAVVNFAFALGILNLVAEAFHFLYPTAPPWYFEMHGTFPASYAHAGHPAGLRRLDVAFNMHFFTPMYMKSPVVFGAFPSLHAGWPFLIAIFTPSLGKIMWVHVAWVSWAALYLHHHFLLDVLGGWAFAYVSAVLAVGRMPGKRPSVPVLPVGATNGTCLIPSRTLNTKRIQTMWRAFWGTFHAKPVRQPGRFLEV